MKTHPLKTPPLKMIAQKIMALLAGAFSCGMIVFMWDNLISVFRLADPTGFFGLSMQVGAFTANTGIIMLAAFVLTQKPENPLIPYKATMLFFTIKLIEAVALSPCLIGWGDAFCGFWGVIYMNLTAPLIIVMIALLIISSPHKKLKQAGLVLLSCLILAGAAGFVMLTPKNSDTCLTLAEITDRAACLDKFAQKSNDATLCRKIEFRSTRFACLRNVALNTSQPLLCEDIQDAPGITLPAYESPSLPTKDLCYYSLGFKLHSHDMCMKITDAEMQKTCLNGAGVPGQKRKLF